MELKNIISDELMDYLDIELKDDKTESGGVAFVGETVEDFLTYCAEDSAEAGEDFVPKTLDELNLVLSLNGILPIDRK